MLGAILGGAAIGAVGSLLAADKQASASKKAVQASQNQYAQTRADLNPYNQAGQIALSDLMYALGLGPKQKGGGQIQMPTREQFMTSTPGRQIPITQGNGTGTVNLGYRYEPGQQSFDQAGYDRAMQQYNDYVNSPAGEGYGSLLKPFGMEDFRESPNYQFNLEQGVKAIDKASAARGKRYNPATLQDIAKFSQGMASNEFMNSYNMYNQDQGNVYGRLMGMTNLGQNSAAQTGALGANAANNQGQAYMNQGNAQAAGIAGVANAANSAIGSYYNNQLLQQILNNQRGTYSPSGNFSNQG